MGLKSIIKGIVVGLVIVVSSFGMMTSANAFKAQDEAKVISSNLENIYTIYLGMPRTDVDANFSNVKGWKFEPLNGLNSITRSYSDWAAVKAGANLTQRVVVVFDQSNHVFSINVIFNTDSMRMAKELYNIMYSNLVSAYGNPISNMSGGYVESGSKWRNNGHLYELMLINKHGVIYTSLMVRPI